MNSYQIEEEKRLESLDNLNIVERRIIFNSVKRQDIKLMIELIDYLKDKNNITNYNKKLENILIILKTFNLFYSYFDINMELTLFSLFGNQESKKNLCKELIQVCFTEEIELIKNHNINHNLKIFNIRKKVLEKIV